MATDPDDHTLVDVSNASTLESRSTGPRIAPCSEERIKPAMPKRDSFAELMELMKAKKSWSPPTGQQIPNTALPRTLSAGQSILVMPRTFVPKDRVSSTPTTKHCVEARSISSGSTISSGTPETIRVALPDAPRVSAAETHDSKPLLMSQVPPLPISPNTIVSHGRRGHDGSESTADSLAQEMSFKTQPVVNVGNRSVTQEQMSWREGIGSSMQTSRHERLDMKAKLNGICQEDEMEQNQEFDFAEAVGHREVKIKIQAFELQDLKNQVSSLQRNLMIAHRDKADTDEVLEKLRIEDREMVQDLEKLYQQLLDMKQASLVPADSKAELQKLTDLLEERNRTIIDFRQTQIKHELEVDDLKEEMERLESAADQERHEAKKRQNDLTRQLQQAEQQIKTYQARLQAAFSSQEILKGAVHLVRPNATTKLPRTVMTCHECYANNFQCDDGARCHNCTDRDEKCARWRCSIMHKLGECTRLPCAFPHDDGGWLMLKAPRPEW